ncbi:MAG TPA: hypothetical protein VFQ87_01495 [Bradyrhizobium sp.]|jgi:hypothetical protein|nr:hypothetical protein [Bradyrhizobium sp.]
MQYRGKRIAIVQGIEPNSWKWTVHLDDKTVKSGTAVSRDSAMTSAVWLIDRALAKADRAPPRDRPKQDR